MTERLRIGYVCFSSFGGSGVVAAELARGMAQRGHHVHLIASAPPSRILYDGSPVFFHEVSAVDYPLFEQAPYALAVAVKIVEVATEHQLDLVHAHYSVPHATSAFLALQVLGASAPTSIVTLHGTDVTRLGVAPSLQSINRFSVTAADGVTVPSDFLRDAAYERLAIPRDFPIEVVPNFVDADHFSPAAPPDHGRLAPLFNGAGADAPDLPVLVHVSNFRPVKRVLDVVEVFARVVEHRPARLVFVGDGPERVRAAQRVRELGLSGKVSFLGTMSEFASLLRDADVFLLPSESESFGLAALEALSSGVPVVAYRVGGLPEVVKDGETGLLTPHRDVDAMARAVGRLLDEPELRLRMAQAARADVLARFACAPAFDRYEAYYRRIVAARQGST